MKTLTSRVFMVAILVHFGVLSPALLAQDAQVTQSNIDALVSWVRAGDQRDNSLKDARVTLSGNYIFNGNTGSIGFMDGKVGWSGQPEKGQRWAGIATGNFRSNGMMSRLEVYCQNSADYHAQVITAGARKAEQHDVVSTTIPATVTGTIDTAESMLNIGKVVLRDGCTIEFAVPDWTEATQQTAQQLQVSAHIAAAAADVEASNGWQLKRFADKFEAAFMADGIYDNEEVAFVDMLVNQPGMYVLTPPNGAPVRFRNFWIPRQFDNASATFTDSLGRLRGRLSKRELPTEIEQQVQAAWASQPMDIVTLHNLYSAHEIGRSIVYSMVYKGVYDTAMETDVSNAWQPLRTVLWGWNPLLQQLPEPQQSEVRTTLGYITGLALGAARRQGREIPTFLDSFLQPK